MLFIHKVSIDHLTLVFQFVFHSQKIRKVSSMINLHCSNNRLLTLLL